MTLSQQIEHAKAMRDYYQRQGKTKAMGAWTIRLKDLRTRQLRADLQASIALEIEDCKEVYQD